MGGRQIVTPIILTMAGVLKDRNILLALLLEIKKDFLDNLLVKLQSEVDQVRRVGRVFR